MDTLLDLTVRMRQLGSREAVRWSNSLRRWVWTYTDLYSSAGAFSHWLELNGIGKGDRVMIWGENRAEWIAVFWGALARGVALVPVDFRFSPELALHILRESKARLLVHDGAVHSETFPIPMLSFDDVAALPRTALRVDTAIDRSDVVEIVYTSGTTGDPKGVVHRHRNICANLEPFQLEIEKYRKLAAPFQPIRILNLLPLSHMFGQSMGLFIPVLLGGAVAFTSDLIASAVAQTTREQRISVIVGVPRMLENFRSDIQRRFDIPAPPRMEGLMGVALRWWRYRRIHRQFGWKFWAFVVGGALVEPELEEFWGQLGFLLIQGYGLTEASPVVAVNHPFDARRGSLGKVVPGQDVVIAADGEILVRGESVTNEGGGWLHTGDIGSIDADGRLYFRGRKKDLIVTGEGLNVYPHDVETVLNSFPEVRDSAVVAVSRNGGEQVHAALILSQPDADPASVVRRANERLEAHQRIQNWTVWPDPDFPRTPSTMKIKRHEIAAQITGSSPTASHDSASSTTSTLDRLLLHDENSRLSEDIGLSSLDRVEVMSELETRLGAELDEEQFAGLSTVGELKHWAEHPNPLTKAAPLHDWPVSLPVRCFRWIGQHGLVLPVFRHYIPLEVTGLDHLSGVKSPVLFAANHTSHLDTVAILAALPHSWRRLVTPAMSPEHFRDWFNRRALRSGLNYFLARALFNAYPLPQEMAGTKRALEYTGEMASRGWCPLVFPEGIRTPDGNIRPFRPGIGLMAVRLRIPVVPIRVTGLFEIYSEHANWPKPGPARVTIGEPLRFTSGTAYDKAAQAIEQAVRSLR